MIEVFIPLFMEVIWLGNSIWHKDDEYYKLEPLTDEMVKEAEEKLKIKLPQSYINILKEQNGGYIKLDSYPSEVPTSLADNHINVDHILGIGEKNSILESEYLIEEWGLPNNIVLISGSGHSWIALDYRDTKEEPPIIYIDVESEQIIRLAPDFGSFLNGLFVDETESEDDYYEQEERNWTLEQLKIALSTRNEQEVIPALNYLYENPKGNEQFIEQSMIVLLQSSILEIKQLAANYANHFNETGILSSKGVKEIVSIIRSDNEIEFYADMFFIEN
jgi:hypothetical protein